MGDFMIAGINQPYFMPYLGYWQLINAVDIFAIADAYNFMKGGWIHRNRILDHGQVRYYNIPISRMSQNRFICDHELKPFDIDEKLKPLQYAYSKAANFDVGMDVMRDALACDNPILSEFLLHTIRVMCDYLGIDTKVVRVSDYPQDPSLRMEQRIFDYCRQFGASTYYNPIGGMELYSFDVFRENGFELGFVKYMPKPYPQDSKEFIPSLSIIDVIMNTSREETQSMLDSCRIITESCQV